MPRRTDLRKILIIGSGPIAIGQACEFDYSGTQALKALRSEGYDVVLINSNPATLMTDPQSCARTYIEPLVPDCVEAILAKERPQALLPTVGGQTALNITWALGQAGVLDRYGLEILGASMQAISVAEDRGLFRSAMQDLGLAVPLSQSVQSVEQAHAFAERWGYPVVIRASFTLGGTGGGMASNPQACARIVEQGLALSPLHEVLVEESLLGWKEYELEVMRDSQDNAVVVCSIENVDPMGVHTGDSITVAPIQTLTNRQYQAMRDAAMAILRRVGVATGGANVQFAINPQDGRMVVIEMNPRVSRSSALASKATGFPIAKIAAKLAVGYSLAEIPNDLTQKTPAAFEPTLDYVVTKIPKFAFEKFPEADTTLGLQMKSVGEVMALGRTFKESLLKALRCLGHSGEALKLCGSDGGCGDPASIEKHLSVPHEHRLQWMVHAMEQGWGVDDVVKLTRVDPWFVDQMHQLAEMQRLIRGQSLHALPLSTLRAAKAWGFSDRQLADLTGSSDVDVRRLRRAHGVVPVYKRVDTCAAEFESYTPYFYSTYEEEDESNPQAGRKVMVLGSGANAIGQGIEFDYCCSHAALTLSAEGIQSIMVNCNPETVSTDYDTSDRLYFEPLTLEDILEVVRVEQPEGVIVQFGGQTALNVTAALHQAGVRILGTSADAVDLAEDRRRFNAFLDRLLISYPPHAFASTLGQAEQAAQQLGYPVLVRPSYVLGGRAMAIVYGPEDLKSYVQAAFHVTFQNTVLMDTFLENAVEIDVDALCDGQRCIIAGMLQHIEQAGIHSGDSCAVLPLYRMDPKHVSAIETATRRIALALGVVGTMNVQFAIAQDTLYVLEVNPRASRTLPFVAKATGVPLARLATQLMLGQTLASLGFTHDLQVDRYFVKAPVFPFAKFPGVDPKLSPEMRSTGEVMGMDHRLGIAFYKAQLAAGTRLPTQGTALVTVNARDHQAVVPTAQRLKQLGFDVMATRGTAAVLRAQGLDVEEVQKKSEAHPHCVDAIHQGRVDLIINTPLGGSAHRDGWAIRTAAIARHVPLMTTLAAATMAVEAIAELQEGLPLEMNCLQDIHTAHPPGHPIS